eukprot:Tbor_TRINITY_DN3638_c0_g1::TRINITY_DN3638_c0_g1_i1::g.213::m.213
MIRKGKKLGNISDPNDRDIAYTLACIENEIEMLQRFHHPNVIRATDIFTRNNKNYVVLPVAVCSLKRFMDVRLERMNRYLRGDTYSCATVSTIGSVSSNGFLLDKRKDTLIYKGSNIRFSSRQICPIQLVKDIIAQLLAGLSYMHLQKCYHNDLKPSNVLLFGDGTVKLADFGCCGSKFVVGKHGTPVYLSPQVVANLVGHELPGVVSASEPVDPAKNDAWACGCILYQLLTGMLPVACLSPDQVIMRDIDGTTLSEFNVYDSIVNDKINFDIIEMEPEPQGSKDNKKNKSKSQVEANKERSRLRGLGRGASSAKDLVMKLLTKDQEKRINISKALEHPWMQEAILRSTSAAAAVTPVKKYDTNQKDKKEVQKNIKYKNENTMPLLSSNAKKSDFIESTIKDPQGYISPPPFDNATLLPLTGSEKNLRRVFDVLEISLLIDRDYVMHTHLLLQVAYIWRLAIPKEFLSHPVIPYRNTAGNNNENIIPLNKPSARSCLYSAIDGRKFIPESETYYYSTKKKDDRDVATVRKLPVRKEQLVRYINGVIMACEMRVAGPTTLGIVIPGNTRGVSSGGVKRLNSSNNLPTTMREFFNGYDCDAKEVREKKRSWCYNLFKFLGL